MTDLTDTALPQQRVAGVEAAVEAYLAGWNSHDGAAVAAVVTGSYVDPTLPAAIRGDIAAYVDGLCTAFPDLRFVSEAVHVAGDVATAQWRMQGTNDGGPLPGAPAATNGTIDLSGLDVITVVDGQVDTVVGYFDQKAFIEQLGLQAIIAPQGEWPVSFGLATRVDLSNATTPGALSMTWIEVEEGDAAELQQRTTDIVTALASDPAFIAFQAASVGPRNVTLTAWTSPEAAEAALARNAPHTEAMDRVTKDRFAVRGFTSIWQPYRLNHQFATCGDCHAYVSLPLDATEAVCECGASAATEPYL
jgi:predicted ester cyclase